MENLVTWFQTNWVNIAAIVGGIVTIASVIVKLTPTPKDDAVLAKIIKVMETLSIGTKKGSK